MMYYDILKKLRKEKQLTQEQLGKILNISTSTVSMYENGTREPDLQTLIRLSEFYGVTTDFILGLTDNPYPASMTAEDILNRIIQTFTNNIKKDEDTV